MCVYTLLFGPGSHSICIFRTEMKQIYHKIGTEFDMIIFLLRDGLPRMKTAVMVLIERGT